MDKYSVVIVTFPLAKEMKRNPSLQKEDVHLDAFNFTLIFYDIKSKFTSS